MNRLILGAMLALGVGVSAPAIAGPTLTFTLTQDGCTGGCGTGPWGTVVVAQSTTNASQVIVTETLENGAQFISSGAGKALEFSILNDPAISFLNLTTGFGVGPAPATASTFGTFDYSVSCTSCGNGGSNPNPGPLSFTLSATDSHGVVNLTPQSFISSVNNQGVSTPYFFTSDIIDGRTGNVAALEGRLTNAPEPMSVALLGAGLVGLTILRRKQAVF